MIEFEILTGHGSPNETAPIVLSTDQVSTLEPLDESEERCLVVLKSGRQMVADMAYDDFRRLMIEARSGFATVLRS